MLFTRGLHKRMWSSLILQQHVTMSWKTNRQIREGEAGRVDTHPSAAYSPHLLWWRGSDQKVHCWAGQLTRTHRFALLGTHFWLKCHWAEERLCCDLLGSKSLVMQWRWLCLHLEGQMKTLVSCYVSPLHINSLCIIFPDHRSTSHSISSLLKPSSWRYESDLFPWSKCQQWSQVKCIKGESGSTLHPKELTLATLECLDSLFILVSREKHLLYSRVLQLFAAYDKVSLAILQWKPWFYLMVSSSSPKHARIRQLSKRPSFSPGGWIKRSAAPTVRQILCKFLAAKCRFRVTTTKKLRTDCQC